MQRFYADAPYFVEQVLSQKLWRWDTFPDDGAPIEPSLPGFARVLPRLHVRGHGAAMGRTRRSADPGRPSPAPRPRPAPARRRRRGARGLDAARAGVARERAGRSSGAGSPRRSRRHGGGAVSTSPIQLRGYEAFLADTAERPEFAHGLLDRLAELRCRWWEAHARRTGDARRAHRRWPTTGSTCRSYPPRCSGTSCCRPTSPSSGSTAASPASTPAATRRRCSGTSLQIRSLPQLEVSAWTSLDETLVNVPATRRSGSPCTPTTCCAPRPRRWRRSSGASSGSAEAGHRDRHLGPDPAVERRRRVRGDGSGRGRASRDGCRRKRLRGEARRPGSVHRTSGCILGAEERHGPTSHLLVVIAVVLVAVGCSLLEQQENFISFTWDGMQYLFTASAGASDHPYAVGFARKGRIPTST